jgi:hypothetical protein
MKMRIMLAALVAAAAIFSAFALMSYSCLFWPLETANCARDDAACAAGLDARIENCTPSSTIIEGRDGIVLMVNITREGDRCVRTETVVGSTEAKSEYLLGHNVTCESDLSELDKPESLVCPGSLYDYVMPSGGEGGAGAAMPPPGIPEFNCGVDDDECKTESDSFLQNCLNAKIINTDLRWEPDGYWTLLLNVSRQPEECDYYVEVLNAVNLPPGVPATIIGDNMTCNVPLSEIPIQNLTAAYCSGDLYTYLYP